MEFGLTEEQIMFRDTVYRFAKNEIVDLCEEADLKSEFSFELWKKLGEMGLLGLPFPEELGGSGADVATCCVAAEALGHAGVDQGHLLALGAHTYLGTDTIYKNGNDEQRKKYIPKLATGEWICCMGLTEPGSGSDAASMSTTAVKKGDKYILNGSKTFITNAPICNVCVVFATVDKKLGNAGISAFAAWQAASQEMYNASQQSAGQAGADPNATASDTQDSSSKDDEVTDVDFEEVKEDK